MLDKKIFFMPSNSQKFSRKIENQTVRFYTLDLTVLLLPGIIGGPCEPDIFAVADICYMSLNSCSIQIDRIMTKHIKCAQLRIV